MHAGRTRVTKSLRGGLVVVAPSWAEQACAQGAVDLWSGREFALRLRAGQALAVHAPAAGLSQTQPDARAWHRLAPIEVMRALREDGPEAASERAAALAAGADPENRLRLEVVAAGAALERGARDVATARALAAIDAGAAAGDILDAAIEIAAAGTNDHALAARLWRRASDALRESAGDEHPDTLASMSNLAATLGALGDAQGARGLHGRVLEARRRVLGEEHPDTLMSMNNFAATLGALGDAQGAREQHGRVLEVMRRVLGEEHPSTLTSMNNLAETLWALRDAAGARELHERVLEARRRVLGAEHPSTLASMNDLAALERDTRAGGDAGEDRPV